MSNSLNAAQALHSANSRWLRLLDADPKNAPASLQLVSNLISADELDKAESLLSGLSSDLSDAQLDRRAILSANLLTSQGDMVGASAVLKHEIDTRTTSDDVYIALAQLFLQLGRNEQVLETVRGMTQASQKAERVRLIHARALARLSLWTECASVIGDPQSYQQHRASAVELLYNCYVSDRRFEFARDVINQIGDDLGKAETDSLRGRLAFATQDYKSALEHFRNAKSDDKAIVWLVRTLYAINRRDDAATEAALLDDAASPMTRALCWEAAGHLKRAVEERRLLAYSGVEKSHWSTLAEFHYRYRDWGRAWETLADAERAGIHSEPLRYLRRTLIDGFDALGVKPPRFGFRQRRFQFHSSERIIEQLCRSMSKNLTPIKPVRPTGQRRIALVINSLGPGGAERQVVNLANGLATSELGFETHLLCTHLDRGDRDRFYIDQVNPSVTVTPWYDRHRPIDASDVPALAPYSRIIQHIQPVTRREKLIQIVDTLAKLKPDAVHGWLDETFILTSIAGRLLGIPVVAGRWGSMPPGIGRTVSERDANDIAYLQSAYRSVSRLPHLTLSSNSRLTGDAYASLMRKRPNNVHIVYNGIDAEHLQSQSNLAPALRKELGIPSNAPIVGSVFRMTEEKRPLLWVKIAARLAQQHPDWHFVIVGEGPLRCDIEDSAAELGLKNLHLPGSRNDIGACLAMMDVMLLTSRVEGVSNAVVEAQFCGCPVVAPNVGGLSEAMEDVSSGILLPSDAEEDDFVMAIESLLESPQKLAQTAESARNFAASRFSVEKMVSHYTELLCTSQFSG